MIIILFITFKLWIAFIRWIIFHIQMEGLTVEELFT